MVYLCFTVYVLDDQNPVIVYLSYLIICCLLLGMDYSPKFSPCVPPYGAFADSVMVPLLIHHHPFPAVITFVPQ
ncbi:hypothetical protein RJT34_01694 [Clitoria ternatea]|uniref:Uncharacterized protein n=1 Tax=Clitoria ternatea TaxID=43366 RepID=A0AAN9Q3G3_CLITE